MSSGPSTSANDSLTLSCWAASSRSRRISGHARLATTVNRVAEGTISFSGSMYFWLTPGTRFVRPVTLAELAEALAESGQEIFFEGRRRVAEVPETRDARLLPLGRERRSCEADSKHYREPDPSHEHLGWDGWRESSRRWLSAGAARVGRAWLLDDVIRPQQQRLRDRQTERFSGLHVEDQLELRGLLDGQVGRLGALEDLVHVGGRPPKPV